MSTENTALQATQTTQLDALMSADVLDRLGYEDSKAYKVETDEQGNKSLTLAVGSDMEMTLDTATVDDINNLDIMSQFQNFDNIEPLYKAWYSFKLKDIHKGTDYKNVGDFLSANIKGLDAKTINKYAKIGELFLTADANGKPIFKDEKRFKGSKISNISQCWRVIETVCECDLDRFYNDYMKTGVLPIKGKQNEVKAGMNRIDKDGNILTEEEAKAKSNKGKTTDNKTTTPRENIYTPETHLRLAVDAILEKCPADNNKVVDRANKAYGTLLQIMIDLGMVTAPEQTYGQEKNEQ